MLDKELYLTFFKLSKKRTSYGPFDASFHIDGIPLRWYFHTIITSGTLPSFFASPSRIKSAQPLGFFENVRFFFGSIFFQLFLAANERFKRSFHSHQRIDVPTTRPTTHLNTCKHALFLTFPQHISYDNDRLKLFRIGGIVDILKPDASLKPFIAVAHSSTHITMKRLPDPLVSLYSYSTPSLRTAAAHHSSALASLWKKIGGKDKMQIFMLENASLWPKLRHTLNFLFSRTFLYYTSHCYLLFDEIIKKERIAVAVVTSMSGFLEKCLFAAAKKNNIPVVVIQHGASDSIFSNDYFLDKTKLAVFSDYYKKKWIDVGMDPTDVVVTGPVIFEGIERFISKKKPATLFQNILILTQPFARDGLLDEPTYLSHLVSIIGQLYQYNKNAQITLKLHPRESTKDYSFVQSKFPSIILSSIQDRPVFYSLINKSDVVLNFGSTAILEALIIGRPTITVELHPQSAPFFNTLIKKYDASPLCSHHDVFHTMNRLGDVSLSEHFEGNRKRFIKDFCYKIDGKVVERVAGLIKRMAR